MVRGRGRLQKINANKNKNQGKLEVVKQELARVNVDILGLSKLKWTEMDDHYYLLLWAKTP